MLPRGPPRLFLENFPHHERGVSAADSDQDPVTVQEACTRQRARVRFSLVEFGTRTDAWVSEQSQITISIAGGQHIVAGGTIAGGDDGRLSGVVAIVPNASHEEAGCTVVCQPLDIFHGDRTSLR